MFKRAVVAIGIASLLISGSASALLIHGEAFLVQPIEPKSNDGPQDSPWPMFCHDVRHTGRSPYNTSGNAGFIKWKFKTEEWVDSSPAIDKNGTIYVGSCGYWGPLYAVYPNGTEKWGFETNPGGGSVGWIKSSPAIGEDGTVYVGSFDGNLYAINSDGTEK
jgi:hypothetical protein